MRRGQKPSKTKAQAKRPVSRPLNDGAKVRELEDQQAATSAILEVISRSPSEARTVFDMIAESAARLCDAIDVTIFQIDSEVLRVVVHKGPIPSASAGQTRPLVRETPTGRAVLDRRTIHIADVQAAIDEYPEGGARARRLGYRTILAAPLLHAGEAIGAIVVRRTEVRPFTERQVDLLHTFANQAVIAVENVRLFDETKEALEQQTATSRILHVISTSPTDLTPVMAALVESAARLCEAQNAQIFRVEPGDQMRLVARYGPVRSTLEVNQARAVTRGSVSGRCIVDRVTLHIADLLEVVDSEYPDIAPAIVRQTIRTTVGVPLLREGVPIGAITAFRTEVRPFSKAQVALLQTFADQAVIAIENVRLFTELEGRNRDLSAALDQQTATSEILQVISRSPTDTQPVFDAIAQSAARLCSANDAQVLRVDGEVLRLVAACGVTSMPRVRQLTRGHLVGRAVIDRRTIQIRDLAQAQAEYPETTATRYGITTRSDCSRPSPTRRSSRSRTCGCSPSCRPAPLTSHARSTSSPRSARSVAPSAPRSISKRS
jgi:GAF domain-containing protein